MSTLNVYVVSQTIFTVFIFSVRTRIIPYRNFLIKRQMDVHVWISRRKGFDVSDTGFFPVLRWRSIHGLCFFIRGDCKHAV